MLAILLQMSIGLLFNCAIFILVIQSSTVIGMFLNFAALAFITEIDDLAFSLASRGYFTRSIQESTEQVEQFETPNAQSFWLKRLILLGSVLAFLTGYGRVASQQNSGTWLCERIEVQFGDAYYSQAPYYSGMYRRSDEIYDNGRFIYLSEDGEKAAFRYCNTASGSYWVWGELFEFSDGSEINIDNLCDDANWIARSPETKGFDLADITDIPPNDWVISTSTTSNIVYPIDHFVLRCADCSTSTCEGVCEDNICQCNEGQIGSQCHFLESEICPVLDKDPITLNFPQDDDSRLTTEYTVLLDLDGSPVLAYGKPVYYSIYTNSLGTVAFGADVLVFLGHRYYAGYAWRLDDTDYSVEELSEKLVDLLSSFHYISYLERVEAGESLLSLRFGFASDTFDVGQSSDQIDPTDKRWYKVDTFASTLLYQTGSIDVGTVLICAGASCNSEAELRSEENPCPTIAGSDSNFCRSIQENAFFWAAHGSTTIESDFNEFCDCLAYSQELDSMATDDDFYLPSLYYGPFCKSRRIIRDVDELVSVGLRSPEDLVEGIVASNTP